jgi:peptidoglycan hydrolase CwlO-like protein|tara:strand:- start:30462 stop:30710 length:249 start_codon:yes stop_codon:yes gene_type:complete
MWMDDMHNLGLAFMRTTMQTPTVYVMKDSEYNTLMNKKIDSRIQALEEHKKSLQANIENVDKQIKALQGQRTQDAPVEETKS